MTNFIKEKYLKVNKELIIAHRGESETAPENTLSSIKLAWELNDDAVEVDVRLTKDKQVVVFHDANTKRLSGKYKWIFKTNLNELKKLDIGKYKSEKYTGEQIPTLQEVLRTVPNGKKIIVEIKARSGMVPYLKDIISNSGLQTNQIEIISFNFKTLIEVRKKMPDISVFWILALDYNWFSKIFHTSVDKIILKAKKQHLHGLDLWAGEMLNAEMIRKIKAADLKIYAWTLDDPEKARALFEFDVDGITTNRAYWLRNQLNEFK